MNTAPLTSNDPGVAEIMDLVRRTESGPISESIGSLVKDCATRFGDRTAVTWFIEDVSLSYNQIDALSDRLAAGLVKQGYRKGAHIALMMPNSPEFLIAWFAIAKLGAVMVPVNTAYRGHELDYILNQSDAQALFIHEQFREAFGEMETRPDLLGDRHVHWISDLNELMSEGIECAAGMFEPPVPITRGDLMNLQYTSGTTGFPKGCMLTHDYWTLIVASGSKLFTRRQINRPLFWAPFFYMDGQWQILAALNVGATSLVASRMSLKHFLTWIDTYEIDYCIFPEPLMKAVPERPQDRDSSLKYVMAFGWRPEAAREMEQRFNCIARDGFGMTEVGGALFVPDNAGSKLEKNICGIAGPYRETRVVDADGRVCGPDEPGELQIRGRSIMLGYYKRPDANAESFDGDWFRTGDLFVKDADGYHRIVGRLKEMIKRAGENISANEVEAVLRAFEPIAEAAAVAAPDETRREEVLVYVTLKEGYSPATVSPEAIADHCSEALAAFKQPRYIAFVDEFPRTPTRKITKTKLHPDMAIAPIWDRQTRTLLDKEQAARLVV